MALASSTQRRYDVAVASDSHSKVGVLEAAVPVGRNGVATPGTPAAMVQVNACIVLSRPSEIVACTLNVPTLVGVPERNPVFELRVRPVGRPVAE